MFISSGIQKGKQWQEVLRDELGEAKVGIFCLTKENLHADWLLFEAGALSRTAYVCTFLLDLKPTDIEEPLAMFQHTIFDKDDIRKLLRDTINKEVEKSEVRSLDEKSLDSTFEKYWTELEAKLKDIVAKQPEEVSPSGDMNSMVEEIPEIGRRPEIKALTPEERKKLSVSCNPIRAYIPPSIEFEFEIDNRFDQSFLLDRILYKALAGDVKRKYYICEDACLNRIVIEGNNKTIVSKLSLVANPDSLERINEYAIRGEYDIEWEISIKIFFEGSEGVKLLSDTIPATTKYSDWKKWYKMWKEYENEGYTIKP